ncbi:MAG: hypothetical protein NT160_08945 [Actinobacteria bacterium]|nr:hypothetical protein [Actinomycetota bacterium]
MSSPKLAVTVEQLAAPVPGGIATYTKGLLMGLDQLGLAYEVLGSRRARRASQGLNPEASRLHLAHRLTTAAWHHGLSLRSRPFGVVHATSLLWPRVAEGVQRSVMVHDVAWRRKPELTSTRGARWHEAALSKVLESDAKIFVPSRHVADELALSGTALERVTVVGEGADHLPAPDEAGAQRLLESAMGHRVGEHDKIFNSQACICSAQFHLQSLMPCMPGPLGLFTFPWKRDLACHHLRP